eukprot:101679-Pyramimonas_sp.AAC.1
MRWRPATWRRAAQLRPVALDPARAPRGGRRGAGPGADPRAGGDARAGAAAAAQGEARPVRPDGNVPQAEATPEGLEGRGRDQLPGSSGRACAADAGGRHVCPTADCRWVLRNDMGYFQG